MSTPEVVARKEAAGAPEHKIEVTPEMIRNIAETIAGADYRVESFRDVALEVINTVLSELGNARH